VHRFILTAVLLTGASTAAQAATCDESFAKKGNPVTGLRFTASVQVANMSPASAVGQLNGIVAAKGYDILVADQAAGSMLIEQPATGKARSFPLEFTAGADGTVLMEAKLRGASSVPEAAARAEMCGILNQLKGGKAGEVAAAKGMQATAAAGAPLRMSVLRFSQDITGEAEKNSAAIPLRYKNKSFTLYGPVDNVGTIGGDYRVEWKLLSNALTDIVPGRATASTAVICVLAPGQATYALQLKPGKHSELTGVFDRYEGGRSQVWLKDCRVVK
jgi:hypothetical protein